MGEGGRNGAIEVGGEMQAETERVRMGGGAKLWHLLFLI